MFWFDHKIFGNGFGLRSPHFDNRFYWLSGRLYTWVGGFGAQLQSIQWTHPNAGEERIIAGKRFKPLHSTRVFLWLWRDKLFSIPTPVSRVCVAWSWVDLPDDLDAANAALRELKNKIGDYSP
ncbi:hypothetical protein ACMYR2_2385 [Nitrobacter sp. TKz-YC01]